LLSDAGGTGIDLQGVRQLFLLQRPWTFADYLQIIGRVARIGSHEHLAPEERNVTVSDLLLVKPEERFEGDEMASMDEIMLGILSGKEQVTYDAYQKLLDMQNSQD
jgi:superfamily II DNA/RNA helicase